MRQNPGNAPGTVINNRAGIYFDFNDVVLTNTTTNTITTVPQPKADFVIAPSCVGAECTYDFTYTGGTSGATYHWEFGVGAVPETSSVENPTGISYLIPGTKVISLQVRNGDCISEPAVQILDNHSGESISVSVNPRWNMVSVPITVTNFEKSFLFPTANSPAYTYTGGGYVQKDTLQQRVGYWMKFPSAQTISIDGSRGSAESLTVAAGWNMVGSFSSRTSAESLVTSIGGLILSPFYGYEHGYQVASVLEPGKGYWVKANQGGYLFVPSDSNQLRLKNRITIISTEELPPSPPQSKVGEVKPGIPDRFVLHQAYPNPFNPTTTIQYDLPEEAFVTLKVFSTMGQEVATLLNHEIIEEGTHLVSFNARQLASGVYIYRIVAQTMKKNEEPTGKTYVDVKKMLLMK